MDDNIYSATKGKFSHLNQIDYSTNELFKKFIQYLKDEQYGYTNLTFQHFQEISRLRFEKREIAVEIAESLSKIKRTISKGTYLKNYLALYLKLIKQKTSTNSFKINLRGIKSTEQKRLELKKFIKTIQEV